LPYFR